MSISVENYTHSPSRIRRAFVFCLIPVLAALVSGRLDAQTVATYTFADGTADGWTSFNGATTPTATTNAAYSGSSYSLLTTTNASGAGGPSIALNSILQAGAQYTITA
jgi:endo-1,4-beta-xylanase